NIGLTVACDKMINDWFIRRRGLAQGIKFGLISVLGILVVQVVTLLVTSSGWRFTCLVWGLVMLCGLPFAYFLVKPHRPEQYGMLPDGATASSADMASGRMVEAGLDYASGADETEHTFAQAVKTGTFWFLLAGYSVHNIIASGFNLHAYPFLTDIGISETLAGTLMGMMIFFTAPSRVLGGIIADRIPKRRLHFILLVAFLLQVIGLGSFLALRNLASVYVLLICHGLSSGVGTPAVILIVGRYYGRKAFGSIFGTMVAFLSPMGLLAPVYYGYVFDRTGSYDIAFQTALGLAVLAVVATLFVRVPRSSGPLRERW
ncbi:MAG: MFS transporter, partial [Dehalococcoidales bacterium]|nr:MFS transporter [Dehalococcoidales bacterium]